MRSLVILTFTSQGYSLGKNLEEKIKNSIQLPPDAKETQKGWQSSPQAQQSSPKAWPNNPQAWQSSMGLQDGMLAIKTLRVRKLRECVPPYFRKGNILIFIGAAGIAVRAIAPLLRGKTEDPAVLVVDERGQYVIPVLSGHIGGANAFAGQIAGWLGAEAVLTTATDVSGVFAVDTFAAQNGYHIVNPKAIKDISSALLAKQEVGLVTSLEVIGALPPGIRRGDKAEAGIVIACGADSAQAEASGAGRINAQAERGEAVRMNGESGKAHGEMLCKGSGGPFQKTLYLVPKCFHIGIGARKGAGQKELEELFEALLAKWFIPADCVLDISSIDVKKNEPAILALAQSRQIPYITYTAEELAACESLFEASAFVRQTVGAGSVCEAAAYLSAGRGRIIQAKYAQGGFTMAIAARDWKVRI